jgi:glycosyltransferase involved in cell wall biosynthesis
MPRVAICICTCDRAALLARVLDVLQRIELGDLSAADLVVIVVDNRADGTARTVCQSYEARLPMQLRFLEESRPGISFARNRGTIEALDWGAEMVAFLDDDDVPRPDWLWRLVAKQRETGADVVFGFWCLPSDLKLPTWLRNTRYFRPPVRDDRNRFGLPAWAGTYNVLMTRRALEALTPADGPFRSEFAYCGGEDSDLFIRAKGAGFAYACAHDSVVIRAWEANRLTLGGVLRRGFLRGGSRVHIARAHLSADQVRALAWSSWRKLIKSLLRLPLGWNRSRMVGSLLSLSHALGEIYAWAGMRYDYYLRRRS